VSEGEEAAVRFRDKHILIDGYNLELKQGTGVKTYALALLQMPINAGPNLDAMRRPNRE